MVQTVCKSDNGFSAIVGLIDDGHGEIRLNVRCL